MNPTNNITVLSPTAHSPRNIKMLGVFTILLGCFSIAAPLFIGIAIQYMVGTALVMGGFFQIIHAFQNSQLRLFPLLSGLLTLACGGFLFAKPLFGISVLTFLLIAYFISSGLVKIVNSSQLRPLPGWAWQLFSGIISLFLGIALWKGWPVSGALAIGIFFGINLIITGTAMMLTSSPTRQNTTHPSSPDDIIDV
jgi:uncharacterized membrane protein HdeD (DUF308 family)